MASFSPGFPKFVSLIGKDGPAICFEVLLNDFLMNENKINCEIAITTSDITLDTGDSFDSHPDVLHHGSGVTKNVYNGLVRRVYLPLSDHPIPLDQELKLHVKVTDWDVSTPAQAMESTSFTVTEYPGNREIYINYNEPISLGKRDGSNPNNCIGMDQIGDGSSHEEWMYGITDGDKLYIKGTGYNQTFIFSALSDKELIIDKWVGENEPWRIISKNGTLDLFGDKCEFRNGIIYISEMASSTLGLMKNCVILHGRASSSCSPSLSVYGLIKSSVIGLKFDDNYPDNTPPNLKLHDGIYVDSLIGVEHDVTLQGDITVNNVMSIKSDLDSFIDNSGTYNIDGADTIVYNDGAKYIVPDPETNDLASFMVEEGYTPEWASIYFNQLIEEPVDGVNIKSFQVLEKMSSNDTFYTVSVDENEKDKDYHITAETIKQFVIGESQIEVSNINDDLVISLFDTAEKISKLCTVNDFETRLFGNNQTELNPDKNLKFRMFGVNKRGYISINTLSKFILKEDEIINSFSDDEDMSKVGIRMLNDFKKVYMPIEYFKNWIYGEDTFQTLNTDDKIRTFSDSSNGHITFGKFILSVLPDTKLSGESEVNSNTKIFAKGNSRGYVTLENISSFVEESMDLPKYTGGDSDVTANATLQYRDSDTYGYMSKTKLESFLLRNNMTSLSNSSLFRTKMGLVSFENMSSRIKDSVFEKLDEGFGNEQNDINDGDGLIFISNGDEDAGTIKNISYITLKNKILNNDEGISLNDDTKLYCENGYITYGDLKNQITSDLQLD